MTNGIYKELTWVAFFLGFTLLIGSIFNFLDTAIFLFLLFYILRNLFLIKQFESWMNHEEEVIASPQSGFWEELSYIVSKNKRLLQEKINKQSYRAEQFRTASKHLEDGIVSLDEKGRIEWYNRSARKKLKLKTRDIGNKLELLIRVPMFIRYIKEGDYSKPLILPVLQGVPRTVSIQAGRYFKKHKLIIIKDIHELYNLAQIRKDFIANASHELRTPLTVINGYLEMMIDADDGQGKWSKPLKQMGAQSKRMQSIISDLLTLSALESENITEELTQLNVPKLLYLQQETMTQIASEMHDIQFEVDELLSINGYASSFTSIVSNLISNAVRYSPKGGRIIIKWYKGADNIIFEVEDSGIGIAPEHIARISERFYRVDAARSRDSGGTGLGLSIVKYALERHKGRLLVESQYGKGSRFICEFPLDLEITNLHLS